MEERESMFDIFFSFPFFEKSVKDARATDFTFYVFIVEISLSIELIKKNGRERIEIRYLFSFSFFEKSVKDARATGYTFIVGTTRVATLTL